MGRLLALILLIGLASPAFAQQATVVAPINQAARSAAITPSDSSNLPGGPTLGIFNGNATACNIAMILVNDTSSVTWQNVSPGVILPVRANRVMSTSTTCSNLLALYQQ